MLKKIALIAAILPHAAVAQAQNITINVGTTPAFQATTLAGSWSFVAKCPLVTTTGTATFQVAAHGAYAGTYIDSLGQIGQLSGKMQGNSFSHTAKTQMLTATENGTISADGMSFTATNSFGCQINGTRQ